MSISRFKYVFDTPAESLGKSSEVFANKMICINFSKFVINIYIVALKSHKIILEPTRLQYDWIWKRKNIEEKQIRAAATAEEEKKKK